MRNKMKACLAITFLLIGSTSFSQTIWPIIIPNTPAQTSQGGVPGTPGEYRETKTTAGVVIGYRFHLGADITNPQFIATSKTTCINCGVYATEAGTVHRNAGTFWKQYIIIGDIYYYHINFIAAEGQLVNAGDLIGTMRQDGPVHVHYQRNDRNYLNHHLSPYVDNAPPITNNHHFYNDGITRTNTTTELNTSVPVLGSNHTLLHNRVDIVLNANDFRVNSTGGNDGPATGPFQLSYEIFDSQNNSINGEQIYIKYDRIPASNVAAVNVFAPGTTYTNFNWILTSSPHDRSIVNGRDYGFDRYFNTLLRKNATEDWSKSTALDARYNGEAAYSDGIYTVRMRARDVDNDATFNTVDRNASVLIDNFRPYVKEVIVRQNDANGPLVYRGHWEWTGSQLKFYKENYSTISTLQTIWIKAIGSEPLNTLQINIPTVNGSTYTAMNTVNATSSKEFTITYNSASIHTGNNQLNFQGSDFNGNALERMFNPPPFTTDISVPIRQNATTWLPAPNPGVDQNHIFNGNIDICSGGSNERTESTCLYVDFYSNLTQITPNSSAIFTNLSAGAEGVASYQWNFGSGATPSTATSPGPHTVTYTTTGNKTITLIATDVNGSVTKTKTSYITVATLPPSGDFNATPTTGGTPLVVKYSAPLGTSWAWSFPGGSPATSTSQNPNVTYISAGIYDASLTMNGITTTKYGLISAIAVNPLSASILYCDNYDFIDCPSSFRETDGIYFEADVSGGQPFYAYLWNFGDNATSTSYNPVHSYNTGTYTVTLTITDQRGLSTTATRNIVIGSRLPSITADFTASDTHVTSTEGPITFTDASTVSNIIDPSQLEYFWDFGDGAYPRYAYTRGPHQVCYNDWVNSKTVFYRIHDPVTYTTGDKHKFDYVYVESGNVNQCYSYTPRFEPTRGSGSGGVAQNCLYPGPPYGIPNGGFSDVNCDVDNSHSNTCVFSPTDPCFSGNTWNGSHGTPSLRSNAMRILGEGAYDVTLDEHAFWSEGFFYQHPGNFIPGLRYVFTFHAWIDQGDILLNNSLLMIDHLRVALTRDLTPITSCDEETEDYQLPSYEFSLHELGSFEYAISSTIPNCYEVYFYPPNNNFNQIWIYAEVEPSQISKSFSNRRKERVMLDNFSIRNDQDVGPLCDDNVIVSSSGWSETVQAGISIITQGTVALASGQSSTFRAGQNVMLNPGFSAAAGSTFLATTGSCEDMGGRLASQKDKFDNYRLNYRRPAPHKSSLKIEDNVNTSGESEVGLKIFPNPTGNVTNIAATWDEEWETTVTVSNIWGLELYRSKYSPSKVLDAEISLAEYPSGVYLIQIIHKDKTYNEKVIKQ